MRTAPRLVTTSAPAGNAHGTLRKPPAAATASRVRLASVLAAAAALASASQDAASRQPPGVVSVSAGYAAGVDDLRRWDAAVDGRTRTGEFVVVSRLDDGHLPGREHEYAAQFFRGVPVHGAGVSRQLDRGVTISLFGTLHQGLDVETAPALSAAEAAARLAATTGAALPARRPPRLVVLPRADGSYVLAYRALLSDGRIYFASAADGRILRAEDAFRSQTAVGGGVDIHTGGRRKLGTTRSDGRFVARDRLRPAEIVTLDARFNLLRFTRLVDFHLVDGLPPGEPLWTEDDVAADFDNDWDDPAVVGVHGHTGWAYDYFAARHGWEGADGANGRILSIVNAGFQNAFAAPPPFGPEGTGVLAYGRIELETDEIPISSLDVVTHELTHNVTFHAVRRRTGTGFDLGQTVTLGPRSFHDGHRTWTCDTARFPVFDLESGTVVPQPALCRDGRFVLGSNQGGAVNEALSDVFATGAGFFHEGAGAPADYRMDLIRSLEDPGSLDGNPDAYGRRVELALAGAGEFSGFTFVGGRFVGDSDSCCYGAEHWNSTILSHAFYLAVEGGANRTTGLAVAGAGDAGRALIERIFFRAVRDLLPPVASLPLAADAIRQAAADLDAGGAAQRAVGQALRAVGLPPGTTATFFAVP